MTVTIIAKLDVKPPYVVKPVHFEGLRKMGSPAELAKKYYDQGADELFYIDIVSSLYQREILFNEIEQVANKLFIPFAAGGGVKSIDEINAHFARRYYKMTDEETKWWGKLEEQIKGKTGLPFEEIRFMY